MGVFRRRIGFCYSVCILNLDFKVRSAYYSLFNLIGQCCCLHFDGDCNAVHLPHFGIYTIVFICWILRWIKHILNLQYGNSFHDKIWTICLGHWKYFAECLLLFWGFIFHDSQINQLHVAAFSKCEYVDFADCNSISHLCL